jgi:hypothetical protein
VGWSSKHSYLFIAAQSISTVQPAPNTCHPFLFADELITILVLSHAANIFLPLQFTQQVKKKKKEEG